MIPILSSLSQNLLRSGILHRPLKHAHHPDYGEIVPLVLFVSGGLSMGAATLYHTAQAPDVRMNKSQELGWQV